MRTRRSRWTVAAALAAAGLTSCSSSPSPAQLSPGPNGIGSTEAALPSLAQALAGARDLGPLPGSTTLDLSFGLAGQDPGGLQSLLDQGEQVLPSVYADRFGPDPALVEPVVTALRNAGLTATWIPGEPTLSVAGTVSTVDRLLGVTIDQWVGADGTRFYAPAQLPPIPPSLAAVVNGIIGLDDYPSEHPLDSYSPAIGVTPAQMLDFYDINPLRRAGLDGKGMTVAFPEGCRYTQANLNEYAQKFSLPAFGVQVAAKEFGQPEADCVEADLDLEVVHAVAPAAREVVYYAAPDPADIAAAEAQMYLDYPRAEIESDSWGGCESTDESPFAHTLEDEQQAAAAEGWSIFVASGDLGAFDCGPDGQLATDLDGGIPSITSVGGTYVELGKGGAYFAETAWGEPLEQAGGGGGLSILWQRPAWQAGPGVVNQYSNGMRQTPDVSANADPESGWEVYAGGMSQPLPVGGTSAAAPFWAAVTALIDQNLQQRGLSTAGFANPALYDFGEHPGGLPAPAFHDITQGTNLYYPAAPGWDFATGLGSPDVAALADDFAWYEQAHRTSG